MSRYKRISEFLQTCSNIRAELRSASKQLNSVVYQLESDNRLLLKALELACEHMEIENGVAPTPNYWIEQVAKNE